MRSLLKTSNSIFNKPNDTKYTIETWVVSMLLALDWSGTTTVNFSLDNTMTAAWMPACLGAPINLLAESNNYL